MNLRHLHNADLIYHERRYITVKRKANFETIFFLFKNWFKKQKIILQKHLETNLENFTLKYEINSNYILKKKFWT